VRPEEIEEEMEKGRI